MIYSMPLTPTFMLTRSILCYKIQAEDGKLVAGEDVKCESEDKW